MLKINLIGLSDEKHPAFSDEIQSVIDGHQKFAGAARHRLLVKALLPENHLWIDVEVPLQPFINQIGEMDGEWVVFASGDPLFFGIGNTLKRHYPQALINIFPSMNSLQMLAHRLQVNYGEYRTVSLTGRPWNLFDSCLIQGEKRLAILTDRQKTPSVIAQRMVDFGYQNYTMHVGERLGGEFEKATSLPIENIVNQTFSHPNCLLLEKNDDRLPAKGIHESLFTSLPGRPKMITKMPVRLTTLAMMALHNKTVLWDVGSCTGSIAIEAKLWAPHLQVVAFEKRLNSREIIANNCQRFGTPGIDIVIDDFSQINHADYPQPDAVFLGGYGGDMDNILNIININIKPEGIIAFNAVSHDSSAQFEQWLMDHDYSLEACTTLTVDDHNPITVIVGKKKFKP
jgi:precorrin-6Y C5,15-methyltransferase (decarboxylating)